MLFNSEVAPEKIELRTDTDLKLDKLKLISYVITGNPGIPLSWAIETCEHGDKGSFTSTVWSQHSEHLSFLDSETEAFGGDFRRDSTACGIYLPHVFYDQRVVMIVSRIYIVHKLSFSF